MLNKVCVVTATRSEYGLLRWLIDEIRSDKELILQLLVTGAHLSVEHGLTYRQIEEDGYHIDEKVEMLLSSQTSVGIVKSMGICSIGIADALNRLSPDLIVVLGDRYELLPICAAALMMNIPIAHISGGDITEGAIDDQVRNAITMMATLHFPGVKDSAERICRMRGSNNNVWACGEPGLDNFTHLSLLSREQLALDLQIDVLKKWVLLCYHSETKMTVENNLKIVQNVIDDLDSFSDIKVIITQANADLGGVQINEYLKSVSLSHPDRYKFYNSLGQLRYLSLMREAACVIGNSSSGIVEAPFLGVPVINIGNRQTGRYVCKNVISVSGEREDVRQVLNHLSCDGIKYLPDTYYGDGYSATRIKKLLKKFFRNEAKG